MPTRKKQPKSKKQVPKKFGTCGSDSISVDLLDSLQAFDGIQQRAIFEAKRTRISGGINGLDDIFVVALAILHFIAAGMTCTRLRRIKEGALSLGDLAPGKWRYLTREEVDSLR